MIMKKTRMQLHNILARQKGFTMVELVVVLLLMSILLSIAIFSGVAWIDWSTFNKENDAAEEIFYAAQNQLTELDSSGSLNKRIQDSLKNSAGEYGTSIILAKGTNSAVSGDDFNGITFSDGTLCTWQAIWNKTDTNNYDKVERTIIKIVTNPGDYTSYLNGNFKSAASGTESAAKRFLFDCISSYISDKGVLDGAIALEFSPEAGQIFAVCYSDRASGLSYSQNGNGIINIKNRELTERKKNLLGYYGVDSLTAKMKGHSVTSGGYKLELYNSTTLALIISKDNPAVKNLTENDEITISVEGSQYYDGLYTPQFSFKLKGITASNFAQAIESPTVIEPVFDQGIYANNADLDDIKFRVPAWIFNGAVYVVLDAADIQAQTLVYGIAMEYTTSDETVAAKKTTKEDAQELLSNTFSFYRFGLRDVNYIRVDASINGSDAIKGRRYSKTEEDTEYRDDENAIHGECVAFANWKEGDPTDPTKEGYVANPNADFIYGIENGRHLYNIRYESDYKQGILKRQFVLRNDIDWDDMLDGYNQVLNTSEHACFLLNSYENPGENRVPAGIDSAGLDAALMYKVVKENGDEYFDLPERNSDEFYFPGYRMLNYGDEFTQSTELDFDNPKIDSTAVDHAYKISNINVSFAANCLYGVYGEKVRNYIKGTSNEIKADNIKNINNLAKSGALPLGLFAESFGDISNIELDNITITGMQIFPLDEDAPSVDSDFVYTSKVGGFVGENFGTISNLFIDVNAEKVTSTVNGRTDVGGIVGHQYYRVGNADNLTNYTLSGCINKSDVFGMAYVGGIIGRIYPKDKNAANGCDIKTSNKLFSDIYIENPKLGTLSLSPKAIATFTIDSCKNYGEVSIDELVTKYGICGAKYRRGFYFGGITGAAVNSVGGINTKAYQKTDPIAVIKNCTSVSLYSDKELEDIFDSDSDEYYINRRLRANYVGGIVGGARYATLINCSTTPDADDEGRSFVFGDRYVGGVVGYSRHTVYKSETLQNNTTYTNRELTKMGITDASPYRSDYSVINGTNVIGNYAVGGISGVFGFQNRLSSPEFYGNDLESLMTNTDISSVKKPYGSRFYDANNNDKYVADKLLNTAIVLGNSFTCQNLYLSSTDEERYKHVGMYYMAIGGIAGYLNEAISNADNIQSEETKKYALKLLGFSVENNASVATTVDSLTVDSVQQMIDKSSFASDCVGGIAGETGRGGVINSSKDCNSRVDAIVFGNNRIGGFAGDTTLDVDRAGGAFISNVYPYKISENSSGLYVIGKDSVGGFIGAFADGCTGNINGIKRYGRFNSKCLSGTNLEAYDEGTVNCGFKVLGNKAVGGVIGTFVESVGFNGYDDGIDAYTINIKIGNTTSSVSEEVKVSGGIFVGGVVGYIDRTSMHNYSEGKFHIEADNINVSSKCFAGGMVGAAIGKGGYVPVDKLVDSTSVMKNISVSSKIGAGGMIGLISADGNSKRILNVNSLTDDNVDVICPIEKVNNVNVIKSKLGIINENINALNLNIISDEISVETYNQVVSAFAGFTANTSAVFDMSVASSLFVQNGENGVVDTNVKVESILHAGGLVGYIPDNSNENANLELKNYTNYAHLKTTGSINSAEAGDGDNTAYSYLGGIIGRVPKGVTLTSCYNMVNGDNYKAAKADYLGGLTELNAGIITGTVGNDTETPVINNTSYSYSYGGVAGFVGVNGNKNTDGENSGVIRLCSNVASIECENVAGIAAAIGGSSTIDKCYNHGDIKSVSYAEHGVSGTGAGIVCSILSAAKGNVSIQNCVNTGNITVDNNRNTEYAAGITYKANNVNTEEGTEKTSSIISLCRNYGNGLKYGITASAVDEIDYCFDASNSEYHMDPMVTGSNGKLVHSTPQLFTNFCIGEDVYFKAEQFYSGSVTHTTQNAASPIASFSSPDAKNSISDYVLGDDKLDENDVTKANVNDANANWTLHSFKEDKTMNSDSCVFEITAIDSDGNDTSSSSASMSDFSIVWDNYYKIKQEEINQYLDPNTNPDYQEWYNDFIGWDGTAYKEDYSTTYHDVALDTIENEKTTFKTFVSVLNPWNYKPLKDYFFSLIGREELYKKLYGISSYGHFLYNEDGDDDFVYILRSKVESRLDSLDFLNIFDGDFNTPAKKYNNDSNFYSEPDIVGGYFSPVHKTYLDYAVQELNYGSNSYCSEKDLLTNSNKPKEKDYYSYKLYNGQYNEQQETNGVPSRYIASYSNYGIKLENNTTSKYSREYFVSPNSVTVDGAVKPSYDAYSRYIFGVYCMMRNEYSKTHDDSFEALPAETRYNMYLSYLYDNIWLYGGKNWDYSGYLKYYLVITDADGNKLSTGLLTAGLNNGDNITATNAGYYYVDKYNIAELISTPDVNVDEAFDSTKIKKIDIIVSDIYDGFAPDKKVVGLRAFKWTNSMDGVDRFMTGVPGTPDGSIPTAQYYMDSIMSAGNNEPISKFYSRSYKNGSETNYKLMLYMADTGIDSIKNNPYDSSYWSDYTTYSDQTVRYKIYEDIDSKYINFIKTSYEGRNIENAVPQLAD